MRRILIVTFYFEPDLSAGSFRMTSFVKALRELAPPDVHLDVVTTMPNRYSSFKRRAPAQETREGITVRRFEVPAHSSGFRDQALAYSAFYRAARSFARTLRYDLVFATSSRLMTAVLGRSLARAARVPLYLDIRDIFTDTMASILGAPARFSVLPVLSLLERRTIRAADTVNLVSRGFAPHYARMRDEASLRFFSNGIDPEFLSRQFDDATGDRERTRILYAGNFGESQGLHRIVPGAARLAAKTCEFLLVGDGGRKDALIEACRGLENVKLVAPVDREALMGMYAGADILFLHLNDYPAFRKVLPSKVFEYAATGKPVLAGVAGYAREFIEQHVENAAVFDPCDEQGMVRAIDSLELRSTPRTEFRRRFAREQIMLELAQDVLALLPDDAKAPEPAS